MDQPPVTNSAHGPSAQPEKPAMHGHHPMDTSQDVKQQEQPVSQDQTPPTQFNQNSQPSKPQQYGIGLLETTTPGTAPSSQRPFRRWVPRSPEAVQKILDRMQDRPRSSDTSSAPPNPVKIQMTCDEAEKRRGSVPPRAKSPNNGNASTPSSFSQPPSSGSLPKTLHLPNAPAPQPPLSAPPLVLGAKRKRDVEETELDPSLSSAAASQSRSSLHDAATHVRLPPKPVLRGKKAKDHHAGGVPRCEWCGGSQSAYHNPLFTCHQCYESWHRQCNEPPVDGSIETGNNSNVTSSPLPSPKCSNCVREEQEMEEYRLARGQYAKQQRQLQQKQATKSPAGIERQRERNLAGLPAFNKARLVGFGPGDASHDEKAAYFSSLKPSELVNLLLFSDAVKEGLLVDLLASVSRRHPDLPLFGHPDWPTVGAHPPPPPPPTSSHGHSKHSATSSIPSKPLTKKPKISAIRKIQEAGSSSSAAATAAAGLAASSALTSSVVVDPDEEPVPDTWPEAGKGLYAMLPPEKDDPLLVDDNDEESFSLFFVDRQGRQIVEPIAG